MKKAGKQSAENQIVTLKTVTPLYPWQVSSAGYTETMHTQWFALWVNRPTSIVESQRSLNIGCFSFHLTSQKRQHAQIVSHDSLALFFFILPLTS